MKSKFILASFLFCLFSSHLFGQTKPSLFRDTTDNAIDLSNFLLSVSGFLPVPIVITEPALGYGGGLFAAYFHKKESNTATIDRPDISVAGGGGTQNSTWFAGGGHMGFWNRDRIRYTGLLFYASPKLTFYPKVGNNQLEINTSMEAWFFDQSISFKIAKSNWFIGGEYLYYSTKVKLANADLYPEFEDFLNSLEIYLQNSGLGTQILYDSRDKIYTPNKGIYWSNKFRYFPTWLGTTREYGAIESSFSWFFPIVKNRFYMALNNRFAYVFNNAPFYALPFIYMRGIKAMRYQGEVVNTIQAEGRLIVYKRWSLVGFGGVGYAASSLDQVSLNEGVWAGGTGFRYLLASLFNMQAGLDFAWSEKDPLTGENQFAFYITVGTALR